MPKHVTRRQVLATGMMAASAAFVHQLQPAPAASPQQTSGNRQHDVVAQRTESKQQEKNAFSAYSRFHPTFGGPPDSDQYLGKLVPGLRASGLEPVPMEAPDLGKVPWKMVDGVKEFEIRLMHVRGEFLPDRWMNVWGINGSMPGPTIEAVQGDRVRFIVHNEFPEPAAVHWHGLELPVEFDGVPGLTQDLIPAGTTYIYEYDLHQTGSFFYHSHVPMQEGFGVVGFFIIHPEVAYEPTVDRDFGLIFQNFWIPPNSATPDTMRSEWNWHTINGRSGPYTTPMVCKHGERVRIRILDFSPMQHHPIHFHGHTFWLTGTEAGRIPVNAWIPRNTTLIGVAMVQDFEFVAFNPGDWIFHCHMVHHMMNHMTRQVGPRIRHNSNERRYRNAMPDRPRVVPDFENPVWRTPGYPERMQGLEWTPEQVEKIQGRRETRGMRKKWYEGPRGLMTVLRVLPEDLYHRVMESDEEVESGGVFEEIAKRKNEIFGPEQSNLRLAPRRS